jgi:ribose transport system permease protein
MRRLRVTPTTGLLAAIIVLGICTLAVSSGNLLSTAALSTLTPTLAVAVILAVGEGLVIGTGGIDLSIPYVITLVGSIMLYVCDGDASKIGQAILISLVACVAVGVVNGVLVEAFGLNSLVATLAVGMVVAGITRLYLGPVEKVTSLPAALQSWARANAAGLSVLLVVAVALVALLSFLTIRTVKGRRLVASSAAPHAAYLIGVRSTSYRVLAYTMAAVVYGIGAITLAGLLGSPDLTLGDAYQLQPIVAVVLGGAALTGARINYVATALGAVFLALLDYELTVAGYSAGVAQLAQGLVLAIGLSVIYLVKRRSEKVSGVKAGVHAAQTTSATEE